MLFSTLVMIINKIIFSGLSKDDIKSRSLKIQFLWFTSY